jgi:hypothetical protein
MLSDLPTIYIYTMTIDEEDRIPVVPDAPVTDDEGWLE